METTAKFKSSESYFLPQSLSRMNILFRILFLSLLPKIYYWQWPRGFNNHLNSWLWILDLTLITETILTNSYFTHFFIFPHKFSFFIVWHWLSQSLLEKLPRLGKSWTRKERIISIMLLYTLGREGHHWLISQTRIPVSQSVSQSVTKAVGWRTKTCWLHYLLSCLSDSL